MGAPAAGATFCLSLSLSLSVPVSSRQHVILHGERTQEMAEAAIGDGDTPLLEQLVAVLG